MACKTVAAIRSLNLAANVIVEPTRSDYIRVLAHKVGTRKVKESIVQASFRHFLKIGIIVAMPEPKVEAKEEVKA
jgi:hypothetical protein